MKHIVIVVGSPRKNGNTDRLAQSFAKGAIEAGNSIDIIYAAEKKVNSCVGCNYCYTNLNHKCAINDVMIEYYDRLSKADVIVFATPIYFYGPSSQLKSFIDRLHNPIRNSFKVKKLVLLMACADTINTVFDSTITMYKSVLKYFNLEDGGIIGMDGVKEKGDSEGNSKLEQAKEMGKKI